MHAPRCKGLLPLEGGGRDDHVRPPVALVTAPERGVWRLGKSSAPLKYNQVEPETIAGSSMRPLQPLHLRHALLRL